MSISDHGNLQRTLYKQCINCIIYGWKQPDDPSVMKSCTVCEVTWYCSKQCRDEYWASTHKYHCRYLSDDEVLHGAKHNDDSCLVCKEESRVGEKNMSNPSHPTLPCIMSEANRQLMNSRLSNGWAAVLLEEMTGQFTSKLEATVTLMMRIMLKMKLSKHPLWDGSAPIDNMNAKKLYEVLGKIRYKTWYCGMFARPGQQHGEILPHHLHKDVSPHDEICEVDKIIEQIVVSDEDWVDHIEFRPWSILKIMTAFLGESRAISGKVIAEALGEASLGNPRLESIRLTCGKVSWLWENMIDMLNRGLVSFIRVMEVLCEGDTYQHCYGCDQRIIVANVDVRSISYSKGTKEFKLSIPFFDDIPTLVFCGGTLYTVCGMNSCNLVLVRSFPCFAKALVEMNNTFDRLSVEYRGDMCDYCGGFNQQTMKGYRCAGCKTKVYCGMGCYRKDTVHHNLCCEKKKGAMKRRELARTCYLRSVGSN